MIKKILRSFGYIKANEIKKIYVDKKNRYRSAFTTDELTHNIKMQIEDKLNQNYKIGTQPVLDSKAKEGVRYAQDAGIKNSFSLNDTLPELQVLWYANQTFIGYQLCALLAQNWLVGKCCLMPAKDATRNGFDVKLSKEFDIESEVLEDIKRLDVEYNLQDNLIKFVQFGRVFGIRIALFNVESDDPDYYYKPFNPDGVTPGSYRGISQIDPYWVTPQLDGEASGNPGSINFYVPTWWNINGRLVHRTHLVIFMGEEVADILKPQYIYGGISIPQKIAERVYAAERTANEAPLLALTKRTDVVKADLAQATAQFPGFVERIRQWVYNRDNFGVKMIGLDEEMQQFDTSLNDLDSVIMTQYQLVAAAANVPATKLLGTQPKGFNSTGEYEESNYHEELESIQAHDLTPLIERHHLLLIRSEICPKYNIEPFSTTIVWNDLDAMTAKEQAEVNRMSAETGRLLIESGAIDGMEERTRIRTDKNSGYTGLSEEIEFSEEDEEELLEE